MCIEGGPAFNSAISLSIQCDGQEETDRLWAAITKEGAEGQCGWCTDKWGVSWQITPMQMREYLGNSNPEIAQQNWQALREMKKIDLTLFKSKKVSRFTPSVLEILRQDLRRPVG
jgi:predicted 3-demethylubiquinone-9 3-methyltransferase (glyoxalase superfamily)